MPASARTPGRTGGCWRCFSGHGTEWFAPRNVDYRAVVQGRTVLTNPLNGKTVVQHFANQFTETILSEGAEEGDYTAYQTFKVSRSCGRPSAVLY